MAVKCKQLVYTPTSPLTFRISGGTKVLKAHKDSNGIIHSLEGPDELNLTLGLKTTIKKLKYKVNIIEEVWRRNVLGYDLHIARRTKSSLFLLPMFGGTRNLFMWNQLFMNCFLYEDDCIQLLYRLSKDPLFVKFEKTLSKFKSFITKEKFDDNFILFTFKVPDRQKRNYNRFMRGEYSKFSKLYKMTLLEFHSFDVDDLIGQVIFQSDSRRKALEEKLGCELPEDSELLSIVEKDKEIFNPEIYF
tara:strand:+ start:316 stop:1053 length:738 start_codon:yes stop_codon:yes gene_type:complete